MVQHKGARIAIFGLITGFATWFTCMRLGGNKHNNVVIEEPSSGDGENTGKNINWFGGLVQLDNVKGSGSAEGYIKTTGSSFSESYSTSGSATFGTPLDSDTSSSKSQQPNNNELK